MLLLQIPSEIAGFQPIYEFSPCLSSNFISEHYSQELSLTHQKKDYLENAVEIYSPFGRRQIKLYNFEKYGFYSKWGNNGDFLFWVQLKNIKYIEDISRRMLQLINIQYVFSISSRFFKKQSLSTMIFDCFDYSAKTFKRISDLKREFQAMLNRFYTCMTISEYNSSKKCYNCIIALKRFSYYETKNYPSLRNTKTLTLKMLQKIIPMNQ